MRFRLLRRRLTVSAPRMAVRSALPWPLRWFLLALMLGFSAALALWAFEFGRSIAGLDAGSREELKHLRAEVQRLQDESQRHQALVDTSGSLLLAERTALEQLTARLRQAEAENRSLREDLGLFEKLIPAGADTNGVAIRGLQAEVIAGVHLRWQALVMRTLKNAPEFKGQVELMLTGTREGQPWTRTFPGQGQALQLRQYRRLEGMIDLPPHTVVKTVTVRVLEGGTARATQTLALEDTAASPAS